MDAARAVRQGTDFARKVDFFSRDFLGYCSYLCESEPDRETFTQGLYARMASSSKVLEDFLDFHGAKKNSDWYYYRELVSSVRNLSEATYSQKHIWIRLPFYNLGNTERFEEAGYETHKILITSLRGICSRALAEARRLNVELPPQRFGWDDFPGIPSNGRLESDIDDENLREEQKNIVKITREFLRAARDFEMHGFYEPYSIDEIEAIVPDRINEQEARRFEMVVHSLQSSFDTYVNRSGLEFRNIKLNSLRGHISVVLHLLELTRQLLHYYERHLYEIGYKDVPRKVRDELSKAVKPEKILDRIVNYGLYYICRFLVSGQDVSQRLLNENMERTTIVVGIP